MKDSPIANKLLFVVVIIFVFRGALSSYQFIYLDSSYLFEIEFLLILLYGVIRQGFPSRTITSNRFVIYGVLAWVAVVSVKNYVDEHATGWIYLYSAFHAIFFVYVIDIVYKMREYEDVRSKYYFIKGITQEKVLMALLSLLTFSIALTSGDNWFQNAEIVQRHELIFICVYVVVFKSVPDFSGFVKDHSLVTLLLIAWLVLVTVSLFISPYEVSAKSYGLARYHQTFVHVIFFVFVYQFLFNIKNKYNEFILMVPLSVVVLALVFVVSWLGLDANYRVNWANSPPINDNIRHTGYITTAAAVISIAFLLHPGKTGKQMIAYFVLLLISLAFTFWTGGRAASISVIAVLIILVSYLFYVRGLKFSHLALTCVALVLAAYLAELFKVFDWNGILGQIFRTEEAGTVAMLSGRLDIWMRSIESLEGHWLFGLGPQGYYFMPNRIVLVQPHNLFLQFILEWGLLGTMVFFVLMLRVGVSIIGSIKGRVVGAAFLASCSVLVALTVHGLVDGTYFHGQPSYYIALALAICLSTVETKCKNNAYE